MTAARKAAHGWAKFKGHFRRSQRTIQEYKIAPKNTWNCNETARDCQQIYPHTYIHAPSCGESVTLETQFPSKRECIS